LTAFNKFKKDIRKAFKKWAIKSFMNL
jgi:hypothetical protein